MDVYLEKLSDKSVSDSDEDERIACDLGINCMEDLAEKFMEDLAELEQVCFSLLYYIGAVVVGMFVGFLS